MSKTQTVTPVCSIHGRKLVCPCCNGSKGGKALAAIIDPEVRRQWGKLGGRPRKPTTTTTIKRRNTS